MYSRNKVHVDLNVNADTHVDRCTCSVTEWLEEACLDVHLYVDAVLRYMQMYVYLNVHVHLDVHVDVMYMDMYM